MLPTFVGKPHVWDHTYGGVTKTHHMDVGRARVGSATVSTPSECLVPMYGSWCRLMWELLGNSTMLASWYA